MKVPVSKSYFVQTKILWSFWRSYTPVPEIPKEKLTFTFARSSGPGGQNVNKRNTKVELRFKPDQALWLSEDLRRAFQQKWATRINKEGEFVISCQKYRTQEENMRSCVHRLRDCLEEAEAMLTGHPSKRELKLKKIQKNKRKRYKRAVKKVERLTGKSSDLP